MRRFTVMGFTEAELGFVLAALFAAIAVSERSETDNRTATTRALEAQRDSIALAFKTYRDSVRKRSNKTPRCSEKGEPPDAIAEVRVVGRDRYVLRGAQVSSAQLFDRLAPWIEKSRTLDCHYLVRTIATPGVDGPAHSAAIRRLWSRFDVDDRDR
jgi:hypothetical protein